jgi:F0F1-type ATP synthase assembly protein I
VEPKRPITDTKEEAARKTNAWLQYSGMAFQMGIIILLGALAGRKLDSWAGSAKPWFTILFSLLAIAAALYLSLRDFLKKRP